MSVTFFAAGKAVPQGSTKGFVVNGKVVITSSAKGLMDWRRIVEAEAKDHFDAPLTGPVLVKLGFLLPRPTSYPKFKDVPPTKRPDIDKLVRACLDALTHVAWLDDSQVVSVFAFKAYAYEHVRAQHRTPGVSVYVEELTS